MAGRQAVGVAWALECLPHGVKGGKFPLGLPDQLLGSGGKVSPFGSHSAWLRGQAGGWIPLPASQADKIALGHLPPPHPLAHGQGHSCLLPGLRVRIQGVGSGPLSVSPSEPPASPPSLGPPEQPGAGAGPAAADRGGSPTPVPGGEPQQTGPAAAQACHAAGGEEAEGAGALPG